MSDTDSFIEEVSEEVRRDQLFRLMKKYGWIAILLVVMLVGGAAYNEYSKAQTAATARAFGDGILTALQSEDADSRAAALEKVKTDGENAAVLAMIAATEDLVADAPDQAAEKLQAIALDATIPDVYRHLAELKLLLLLGDDVPTAERMSRLEILAAPGAPFRLLAEEQMAMVEISAGDKDAAITRLQDILLDGELTTGLRRRATQLIVALGGSEQPA